ncbi:hypothetical protein CKO28_25255 [Rhodovibrio sodomensis]|uniref:Uncharacterized protein n=1 Tax=Rhodovibrio sodomensis TaxID=1088 RepID=A0ABS1DMH6_9PROT|nr:hypothetical protein [Rhodovibrio sodomensis]
MFACIPINPRVPHHRVDIVINILANFRADFRIARDKPGSFSNRICRHAEFYDITRLRIHFRHSDGRVGSIVYIQTATVDFQASGESGLHATV